MQVYVNPLRQLRSEMDHLLGDIFAPALEGFSPVAVRGQPAVNLWDQGEELLLEMELPGVKAEQIDVSVAGDELTIKVERPEVTDEGVTYHRRERPTGAFTRALSLPCAVNAERVNAELDNGILALRLPKTEAAKPRKINVASA